MRAYILAWLTSISAFVVAGCSGDDCSSGGCVGGDASADAPSDTASEADVPMGCDLSADIMQSPACIDDGIGVFVDETNGSDTNTGSKASPFKTIGHAIGAASAKPRVYVCAGTYAEDISLTQANAVGIYGGLKCADWSYDGSQPLVGSSTLALHVDGVVKPLVLADLYFKSADGVNPGDSSTAAFVNASASVLLRRVKLRPGAGKAGSNGATGSNWTMVAQNDTTIAGHNASGTTGATDHACTLCTDGKNSTGGGGGAGTLGPGSGNNGAPNLMGTSPNDGKGGTAGNNACGGDNGATATNATDAPGSAVLGKLTASGWTPAAGSGGGNGGPGQGGGGGAGGTSLTAGGGAGGGCGGCGGAGGGLGAGGGASIGLASVLSTVTLAACDIQTVAGGGGGNGAAGQPGQLGGYAGTASSPGCAGGVGGQGGMGAAGGGGAGGISVGVLYTGNKPVFDMTTNIVVPSTVAPKGTGGDPGKNDGIDGVCQASMLASGS